MNTGGGASPDRGGWAAWPVALTIAGSDSGGGAGIQADLRAFRHLGVFGTAALTAVTAQNPKGVIDVHAVPPGSVTKQAEAVFAEFWVGAVKTGMLFSSELIYAVAHSLDAHREIPLVVDPVMVATSGARLLREDAVEALCTTLLPRASWITPNIPEAEIITGRALSLAADRQGAALELAARFGCAVMLKGGHAVSDRAVDFVSDGDRCWRLSSPAVQAPTTHGTGCSLSAALAACLAKGHSPLEACRAAKAYVLGSLQQCRRVGRDAWALDPPAELVADQVDCTAL